jgi:hypothetical protein
MRLAIFGWIAVIFCSVGLLAFGDRLADVAGATSDWWLQASRTPIVDNRRPEELLTPDAAETSPGLAQLATMLGGKP